MEQKVEKHSATGRRYLRLHPICKAEGCTAPATQVDHVKDLREGGAHCDPDNSQALCKPYHSRKTFGHTRKRRKSRGVTTSPKMKAPGMTMRAEG